MTRRMPDQKPHRSEQTVGTDPRLIAAVVERFGPLVVDLAAIAQNAVAPLFVPPEYDSLTYDWDALPSGNRWLNPPFENIGAWAAKCAARGAPDRRILFLVPASTGANWFRDHVAEKARVIFLNGRVTFVGHEDPYPKDCMIVVFGEEPGYEVWTWLPSERSRRAA